MRTINIDVCLKVFPRRTQIWSFANVNFYVVLK